MSVLNLTDLQVSSLIGTPLDTAMRNALGSGVTAPSYPNIFAPMKGFSDFKEPIKAEVIDTFRSILASFVAAQAGITTTVSYIKPDLVTTGVLTFTNGILTSST